MPSGFFSSFYPHRDLLVKISRALEGRAFLYFYFYHFFSSSSLQRSLCISLSLSPHVRGWVPQVSYNFYYFVMPELL